MPSDDDDPPFAAPVRDDPTTEHDVALACSIIVLALLAVCGVLVMLYYLVP